MTSAVPNAAMTKSVRGTQGYAEQADALFVKYEEIGFTHKHEAVLRLLPKAPASVLDIGAGTGADAGWLDSHGYRVVAVEPTAEFRIRAMALHPSPSIEWVDDSLPRLTVMIARRETFDVVMLTAVWMHLDGAERVAAMPLLASLVGPGGLLLMTLRHGPIPAGRVMFEVSADETIGLASNCGLQTLLNVHRESTQAANRDAGVTWTRLAFGRREPCADAEHRNRSTFCPGVAR
jgi:SAM-dependent methyltransferase